jgi:hypothetical protein
LAAAAAQGYRVRQWTLVIPIDLSGPETTWWDRWTERQEAKHSVEIELWDKHHLDTLLRTEGGDTVEAHFFPPFAAPPPPAEEALAALTTTLEIRRVGDTDPYAVGVVEPDVATESDLDEEF